ncbi:MAG: thymidine phosphorylase, partial [Pseudomonadota bacterium]
ARLHEVTMALSAELLFSSGVFETKMLAEQALERSLDSGRAAEIFSKMVSVLGGPSDFVERAAYYLPRAAITKPVLATDCGVLVSINTRAIGMAVLGLGGGRLRSSDTIDYAVGIRQFAGLGRQINKGDVIAEICAKTEDAADRAMAEINAAIRISSEEMHDEQGVFPSVIERVT